MIVQDFEHLFVAQTPNPFISGFDARFSEFVQRAITRIVLFKRTGDRQPKYPVPNVSPESIRLRWLGMWHRATELLETFRSHLRI